MDKSFQDFHKAYIHRVASWKAEVLYTWQWWLGMSLTLIPWIFWIIVRKKDSTGRLLYVGVFVSLVSVTLDNIGVQLSLWDYVKPVTPAIPSYLPYDFSLMPVTIMLLIQFTYKVNHWLIGLIYALITSFIGEPIFKWMGIYDPVNWKHIYSVPFYLLIYVSAYKLAFIKTFNSINKESNQ
ncbi:hypothetical protein PU629_02915 [Pullulanibacillus sp. KACC 23026]|uniref:CBO0543 family protein n=1 Tax=Pullulanibacillus sp. KACC 23026 TaxID=3028315 RepID=UPI0023B0E44E|nr:CBO0543 family protein [Pullulanibacillus sp. KACC 23026]WEG13332.1 hypothetical protein PU629_02915 [Pullulanibacillus sp. KACC 23026]